MAGRGIVAMKVGEDAQVSAREGRRIQDGARKVFRSAQISFKAELHEDNLKTHAILPDRHTTRSWAGQIVTGVERSNTIQEIPCAPRKRTTYEGHPICRSSFRKPNDFRGEIGSAHQATNARPVASPPNPMPKRSLSLPAREKTGDANEETKKRGDGTHVLVIPFLGDFVCFFA